MSREQVAGAGAAGMAPWTVEYGLGTRDWGLGIRAEAYRADCRNMNRACVSVARFVQRNTGKRLDVLMPPSPRMKHG